MSRVSNAGTLFVSAPSTSSRLPIFTGRLMTGRAQLARIASMKSPVAKTTSESSMIPRGWNGGPP